MNFLHPTNVEELANIAEETGAEVLRGPLRYPSDTGGWQLGSQSLVRAIEALGTIEPSGWSERALAGLLMAAYKRQLRAIIAAAPDWVGERILSASQHVGDDRPAVCFSKS